MLRNLINIKLEHFHFESAKVDTGQSSKAIYEQKSFFPFVGSAGLAIRRTTRHATKHGHTLGSLPVAHVIARLRRLDSPRAANHARSVDFDFSGPGPDHH